MNSKKRSFACAVLTALLVVPGVAATHDNDPVPDPVEAVACTQGDVQTVLGLLGGFGGSCTGDDYGHMAFDILEAGPATCDTTTACHQDLLVLSRTELFAGHDLGAVSLPPEDVDSVPVNTPPVDLPVALVGDPTNPDRVCVIVLPDNEVERVCIDFGPVLGPIFGNALPLEQIPGQSEDTPPVEEGQAGATPPQHVPALSVEASLGIDWVNDRLNEQIQSTTLGSYWMPVNILDPTAVEWWLQNAEATSLSLTVTVFIDDTAFTGPEPVDVVSFPLTVEVPYAGQAVAAMLASG